MLIFHNNVSHTSVIVIGEMSYTLRRHPGFGKDTVVGHQSFAPARAPARLTTMGSACARR